MASSEIVVGRSSLVVGVKADFSPESESDVEDRRVSRYRISWGASAMATLPDSAAGTLGSGSSTRAGANWDFGGAWRNIPHSVYRATCDRVTPNRVTSVSHRERTSNISHLYPGSVCLILIR